MPHIGSSGSGGGGGSPTPPGGSDKQVQFNDAGVFNGTSGLTFDKVTSTLSVGGPFNETHGADIASSATVNLETATGTIVDVTGATSITAVTLSEGHRRLVRFTGSLTLTNGASLILPGGSNITTTAGDFAEFVGYAAGVVRCSYYTRITASSGFSPYISTFDATTSWGSPSGGFYTITIPQSTHLKGINVSFVETYELVGSLYNSVIPSSLTIDSITGDVAFSVTEVPDARFAGKVGIT